MLGAAAQSARLAATDPSVDEVVAFAHRRLKAVPEVGVFHAGGEGDWEVSVSGEGTGKAKVEVVGHARPLPLMAAISGALLGADGTGDVLKVSVEVDSHASWVSGSYGDWIGVWG